MNYEFFFLKRLPGHPPQILRAIAPSQFKATLMIARHLGCRDADRKLILKYLSRRGIREAQVENVIRSQAEKLD